MRVKSERCRGATILAILLLVLACKCEAVKQLVRKEATGALSDLSKEKSLRAEV